MGVDVQLLTVDGTKLDEVLDPNHALAKILPTGDSAFHLLQNVDPYCDSIFNPTAMDQMVEELDVLRQKALAGEQKEILLRVRALAARCKDGPDLLLRFIGD
ncbi:MAG TPA: hypothetical protein VH114_02535 [Candidatus Acidoferrum sp.]|nr:hypothetical protein [Candidatus Acidoferrum sp.]